jgi:hypothetical protein
MFTALRSDRFYRSNDPAAVFHPSSLARIRRTWLPGQ